MTTQQVFDEAAPIAFRGPVPSVQVHAHMEFGPYALIHPLDTKVVIQLMFMFGEQTRQGGERLRVTPLTVLERLREVGVVSGNGTRLVGRDAVYESFARLREKGYIRRMEERAETGQRVRIFYEFYDFPAFNPDVVTDPFAHVANPVFPQVGTTSGNAGSGNAGSDIGQKGENQRFPQVKTTSGIAGSGIAGSGIAGRTFPQVGTTSGNAGSPPHPPEEVDTSSPYPLTGGPSSHPSQEGEEAVCFAPKDLAAAEDLLQDLDRPWTLDRQQAAKSAPELLAVLAAQGWPGIREMSETDVLLLRRELTANPGGVKSSHRKVLVKNRIPELLRYSVVIRSAQGTRALVGAQGGQAAAAQPGPVPSDAAGGLRAEGGIPWCGACNKGERPAEYFQRTIERPDGTDVPCRVCHPKYATRA